MDRNNIMECGGFYFIHNFDSGNLGHVERVPTELIAPSLNHRTNAAETPDYEFNLWTRPDCAGTEFENGNRTWFYFGIQSSEPNILVRLNLINLNKQGKMYNQGMAPVTRTLPGKPQWERIRDRPIHSMDDNTFTLTFKYRSPENLKATTFFAFTYPFSFAELQIALNSIDLKMLPIPPPQSVDDIYYHRECLIYSLEGRRVDLLTISSHHGITGDREDRLKNLFPDNQDRPYKFDNKKVIFISARVHPGETPSSFVFNGFLNLLLTRNDPIAVQLRKLYVFKLIPFLNPDGVARGHYRTDTRGVNLNRVYLNPSLAHHPTVYASRALIRYYHFGCEKEDSFEDLKSVTSRSIGNICESSEQIDTSKKKKPPAINSSGTATKANDRQDRSKSANKSSVTIKQPSQGAQSARSSRRDSRALSGDAANLAEQVFDMKLQEKSPLPPSSEPSLTRPPPSAATTTSAANSPPDSLLERDVLRSCLGSDALLSTSEQLNLPGNNPLRPLRDTLKNSISLLMESTSSVVSDSTCPYSECRTSNVKMGWCSDCRQAVSRLEHTMPGITRLVPGYSAVMHAEMPASTYYENIDEYRQRQKQKTEDECLPKLNDPDSMKFSEAGEMFFCTNCFKRYILNENDEEIKVGEPVSTGTIPVSHGDSGEVRSSAESLADGTLSVATGGDAPVKPVGITINLQPSLPAQSEDKGKVVASRPGMLKKKPTPVAVVATKPKESTYKEPESGLYLYIDLHGHASKKGIFMYGNHFEDAESSIECMLLPRVMALNNLHFHFSSCNFTERNMYLKDRRDGMSREGSGRVAVLKATGLVRSYTLECNYNTGRLVNVLPPTAREGPAAPTSTGSAPPPPKYTPHIFEEIRKRGKIVDPFEEIDAKQVGRSLGASILDLTSHHPNSRIPCSEHRNLSAVREWLRAHTRTMRPQLTSSRLRPKVLSSSPSRVPLYARSKGKMIDERKENTYAGAKSDSERRRSPPVLAPRSAHDLANLNTKLARKQEPAKSTSRTRYLADNEPKPKTLTSKRRNILAIRKPNAGKTPTGGIVKAKVSRRSVDDSEPRGSLVSAKLSKRSFARSVRAAACRVESSRCRAVPSSSSDDFGGSWEEVAGGTAVDAGAALAGKRRPFPAPAPARLKKIRLKTAL